MSAVFKIPTSSEFPSWCSWKVCFLHIHLFDFSRVFDDDPLSPTLFATCHQEKSVICSEPLTISSWATQKSGNQLQPFSSGILFGPQALINIPPILDGLPQTTPPPAQRVSSRDMFFVYQPGTCYLPRNLLVSVSAFRLSCFQLSATRCRY